MDCYVDGGYDNIRKQNGYGSFAVYDDQSDQIALIRFELPDVKTNNEAEYMSLIRLIEWINVNELWNQTDEINILTDSRLMVNQVTGEWQIRVANLRELKALVELPAKTSIHWTPRKNILKILGH